MNNSIKNINKIYENVLLYNFFNVILYYNITLAIHKVIITLLTMKVGKIKSYINLGLYGVILGMILVVNSVFAQQSSVYSMYAFNRLAHNPAYAGSQDQLNITAVHRRQWENFQGAPVTSTFSMHKFVKDKAIGLGFWASSDKIGVHKDTRVYAAYAYKIKMNTGILSMGIQAGFNRISSDYSELNMKNPDAVLSGYRVDFNPNFGSGMYYSTNSFYIGLSAPYLINNKLKVEEVISEAKEARYYFLTAGKVFKISEEVKMMPSTLVRVQEGNATGVDVGLNFIFKNLLTVGAVYRSQDALVGLMQMELSQNLSMGYSYDYTTSDIQRYSNGSHEFLLNYRIPYTKLCHTYF